MQLQLQDVEFAYLGCAADCLAQRILRRVWPRPRQRTEQWCSRIIPRRRRAERPRLHHLRWHTDKLGRDKLGGWAEQSAGAAGLRPSTATVPDPRASTDKSHVQHKVQAEMTQRLHTNRQAATQSTSFNS